MLNVVLQSPLSEYCSFLQRLEQEAILDDSLQVLQENTVKLKELYVHLDAQLREDAQLLRTEYPGLQGKAHSHCMKRQICATVTGGACDMSKVLQGMTLPMPGRMQPTVLQTRWMH